MSSKKKVWIWVCLYIVYMLLYTYYSLMDIGDELMYFSSYQITAVHIFMDKKDTWDS